MQNQKPLPQFHAEIQIFTRVQAKRSLELELLGDLTEIVEDKQIGLQFTSGHVDKLVQKAT